MSTPPDQLSPAEKRALLARLKRGTAVDGPRPRPEGQPAPLSPAQLSLWIAQELMGSTSLFHISGGLRLRGSLDVEALGQALGEVMRRHQVLRTRFVSVDGQPRQEVLPWSPVRLSPTAVTAAELPALLLAHEQAPFALSEGPALRATLYQLGPTEHVLALSLHHLVTDGWSMGVLYEDLAALYRPAGSPAAALEALPYQYADYAAWEHARQTPARREELLEWWRSQIADAPRLFELPADFARPLKPELAAETTEVRASAALRDRLLTLAQDHGATLFMLLQAAWALLLHRTARVDDLLIATPRADRSVPGSERLVGYFVDVLLLRSRYQAQTPFTTYLQRSRDFVLEAMAHNGLPLDQLVRRLGVERLPNREPLAQVSIAFQPMGTGGGLTFRGLDVEVLDASADASSLDLRLNIMDGPEGLVFEAVFPRSLFRPATVERMLRHYVTLLDGIAAEPSRPCGALALIDAEERATLLNVWGGTDPTPAEVPSVPEQVAAQAKANGDAVAVVCGAERVTYRELEARAAGLARVLRSRGVGPEVRVGLCTSRSVDMVVGMLGILKAGGAYVPLDPELPLARREYMASDAAVALVVAGASELDVVGDGLPVVPVSARADGPEPVAHTRPDSLAYIIYTSGSTGRPKGVAISHRSIYRLVHSNRVPRPGEARPQTHGIGSDVPTLEIWGQLCHGATVVIIEQPVLLDPWSLAELLRREKIEVAALPPALVTQTLRLVPDALASLHELFTGGERTDPRAVHALKLSGVGPKRITNGYGPTECTTMAVTGNITDIEPNAITPPIGEVIPRTRAYVLDERMQLAPVGVVGELYLGGAGVARGYWKRPDLTAEKFVPDPFGPPGSRLYRTGDLVRWDDRGQLLFLGRGDSQIKIRGHRIELGEIENALLAQEGVREALALVAEHDGEKQLLAYVTGSATAEALQAALRDRLPEVMVPQVVALDAFPLNTNGKVDRAALPAPGRKGPREIADPPRGLREELIAQVWSELIATDDFGRETDFFEIGGHSLLATQVTVRLRNIFGVQLPTRTIFDSPTIAGLAQAIERAIGLGGGDQAITRKPAQRYAASYAQERLWFLEQLSPGDASYNVILPLRLEGPLNVDALRDALAEIVRRHEVLRSRLVGHQGRAMQELDDGVTVALEVEPVMGGMAELIADAEARKGFDLSKAPLWRMRLLREHAERHVLLWTMHHALIDAWSMDLVLRELGLLYRERNGGAPSGLAPLEVQYGDFAEWQRAWLEGPAMRKQLDYWQQKLAGLPPALELPTDRPRPAVQTTPGAYTRTVRFDGATEAGLAQRARELSATPFMLLAAAFTALLHRYTAQGDLAIGTPIAGRVRPEVEPLVGFFLNTLVLRSTVAPADTFASLVGRVRETVLGAFDHQDVPFEKLVEVLNPQRDLSRPPLFQVLFNLVDSIEGKPVEGLAFTTLDPESGTAKFDLELNCFRAQGHYSANFEFNTDLFDPGTVDAMLEHFLSLLREAVTRPQEPLANLELLTAADKVKLLEQWNATDRDYPGDRCVNELITARALERPQAIAVRWAQGQWTYAELEARANRMARGLIARGVGPEVVVALRDERGPQVLCAMLAVAKAGGAFLPLDPHAPPARVGTVLEQAGAPLVLVGARFKEGIADAVAKLGQQAPAVVDLETLGAGESDAPLAQRARPGNLVYLMFTSGSTGVPKGAMVEHRGMVNHTFAKNRDLGVGPKDVIAQTATQNFDIFVFQNLAALVEGGCTAIVDDDSALDPVRLFARIEEFAVTVVNIVPSLLKHIVELLERDPGQKDRLRGLRWMVPTGEALPPGLCAQWLAIFPDRPLLNAYGHTECSDDQAHFVVREAPTRAATPIGKPIQNMRFYVLDPTLRPVPRGVVAELYIGGVGVGRGYTRDSAKTAEKFVPDPFSRTPGARLYKTGDLGRWLPDGTLEFVGRVDHMVKVRGFRIELGEIETALARLEHVTDVVAVVREDRPGDRRLVAYVVGAQGHTLSSAALREQLLERLPEYEVPAAFVQLDALPLSPNGKVDRKALPAPTAEAAAAEEPPQGPIEQLLAQVWCSLLGRPSVSRHDDFFAIGGHSLLATQVVARLRNLLGVEVPLRTAFAHRTVASLAAELQRGGSAAAAQGPLPRADRSQRLPLSFAQERLWFLEQLSPGTATYNIPIAARMRGPLDLAAFRAAFQALVDRHEAFRTRIVTEAGVGWQEIAPTRVVDLGVQDLSGLGEAERTAKVAAESLAFAEGPLPLDAMPWRVGLLKLSAQEHVLLWTVHHILLDAWSSTVALRELGELYDAARTGRPAKLDPLPVQYADFTLWQRERLGGARVEPELAFWRQQLLGAPAMLDLPTDFPRPALKTNHGAVTTPLTLPPALVTAVRAACAREGVTLYMLVQAALHVLLSRYSGQDDVVVGTPVAGRTHQELEGVVGFFANTLAIRVTADGEVTGRDLMARVREAALGAFGHQELPFERLVEALKPERHMGHSPIFQVMLVVRESGTGDGTWPGGIAFEPIDPGGRSAKFDLLFDLEDAGDSMELQLEYSTDLFAPETAQRMLQQLTALLGGLVEARERPIKDLDLLAQGEAPALQQGAVQVVPPTCVEQVAATVARIPSAPAVQYGDRVLSYAQLDRRANAVARALADRGVRPGDFVGLFAERGLELPVAVLGILKAGAAYVPLDPSYPDDRLRYMMEDSAAKVVLTQAALLPKLTGAPALAFDQLGEAAEGPTLPPRPGTSPVYVIYTSGSTGKPKGVVMPDQAMAQLVRWQNERLPGAPPRLLQFAAISFDVSFQELFSTWSAGGTLVMVDEATRRNSESLLQELIRQRITRLHLPFVALDSLCAAAVATGKVPETLREVITSGEQLYCTAHVKAFFERLPGARLFNQYGPTETHVATELELVGPPASWPLRPSIGPAVPYSTVAILDERGRPCPVGVPGDLWVGGVSVANGYHGKPELSAERFRVQPAVPGQPRLYCTGDRARLRHDGNFEYLGRRDDQVKVRGFRIELGEVEAAIASHPQVKEAAAAVIQMPEGDKRLVGYYVEREPLEAMSLRAHVAARLPEFEVPSSWVKLAALPLTPSGKLARRALPVPAAASTVAYRAPMNNFERSLAEVWAPLLGVERVGLDDRFFDLGGSSLLVTRLAVRLFEQFGVRVPIQDLFAHQGLADQAALLWRLVENRGEATKRAPGDLLVPLKEGGSRPPLIFIHPFTGDSLSYVLLSQLLGDDLPVYCLEAPEQHGLAVPGSTLVSRAAFYVSKIRERWPNGPYRLAGFSSGGWLAYEMAQQLKDAGATVDFLGLLDTRGHVKFAHLAMEIMAKARPGASDLEKFFTEMLLDEQAEEFRQIKTEPERRAFALQQLKYQTILSPEATDADLDGPVQSAKRITEELAGWTIKPYTGRMTVFTSEDTAAFEGPTIAWVRHQLPDVEYVPITGEHRFITSMPHVRGLAAKMRERLRALDQRPT